MNPLRLALAAKSVAESGVGFKTAFNTNWHKYGEGCEREEGVTFCPLVLDTFGAWDTRAISETKRLGQALAQSRSIEQTDPEVTGHHFQRLSVLLMRGLAALIVNRIPDSPDPRVNGGM